MKRLFGSRWFVPTVVFVGFLVLNIGITGPAYLSDEVGYLNKAATIAGDTVHSPSSWYGGYSLLIAPAFLISSNPFVEWYLILLLNAIMWAASAWLLQYILARLNPKRSTMAIRLATLGAMAYPSWLSMSGYAFSTTGFVLVLMAMLAALVKSEFVSQRWLVLAAVLAGFLAWIHPLGWVAVGLMTILLAGRAIVLRRGWLGFLAGLGVVIGLVYELIVAPLLNHIMSGGSDTLHYSTTAQGLLAGLTSLHFWLLAGGILVGLLFSTIIAAFGIIVYAALPIGREIFTKAGLRRIFNDPAAAVNAIALLLVVLTIVLTALMNAASPGQLRPDQWVYGRYTDMMLLPLLGLSLLRLTGRMRQSFWLAIIVILAGGLLTLAMTSANTDLSYINKVNIQSFWPVLADHAVGGRAWPWLWGLLGAAAIIYVGWASRRQRQVWLCLLLVPLLVTYAANYVYHAGIIRDYSHISPIYTYVTEHYKAGACINMSGSLPGERDRLYSFYLHHSDVKITTISDWLKQGCEGAYITNSFDQAAYPQLRVISQDSEFGLQLVGRL